MRPEYKCKFTITDNHILFLSSNPHDKAAEILLSFYDRFKSQDAFEYKTINTQNSRINRQEFSKNPNDKIVDFLLKNKYYDFNYFLTNPNDKVADWILENINTIPYTSICWLSQNRNPRIINYLLSNRQHIYWSWFCEQSDDKAVDYIIEKYKQGKSLDYLFLSMNTNDRIADILLENIDKVYPMFWANPNPKIVDYILKNPKTINWHAFPSNPNDRAVDFILRTKIANMFDLSRNTNPRITDIVDIKKCVYVYQNPGIFVLDYEATKKNMHELKRELVSVAMHPNRIKKAMELEKERLINLGFTEDESEKMIDVERLI